jgi:hypothetical protein
MSGPKVINAFTRQEFVPEKPKEGPQVCERSVQLLEIMLERAKTGEVRGVAIATVREGLPSFSLIGPDDHTARDLAVLLLGTDMLRQQIVSIAFDASSVHTVEDDEEEGDGGDEAS